MFRSFYSTTFRSRKLFPMYAYRGNQVLIYKTEMKCGKHLQKLMCFRSLREFDLFLTFQYINFTVKIAMHSMEISEIIFLQECSAVRRLQRISAFREPTGAQTHQHTPVTCAAFLLTAISPSLG